MKKFMSLLLAAVVLCGALGTAVSAAETSVNVEEPVAYCTFAECHEMFAEALLQDDDNEAVPYAISHCQSGSQVGRYIEELVSSEKIGYETRACAHDVQGNYDIQYQYLDSYKAYCTLCDYSSEFSRLRYTGWNCVK